MPLTVPPRPAVRRRLRVAPPFRLDLTVAALRRVPTNRVDVFDGERYLRAFSTARGPVVWEVRQSDDEHLEVALHGAVDDAAIHLELLDRMLAPNRPGPARSGRPSSTRSPSSSSA